MKSALFRLARSKLVYHIEWKNIPQFSSEEVIISAGDEDGINIFQSGKKSPLISEFIQAKHDYSNRTTRELTLSIDWVLSQLISGVHIGVEAEAIIETANFQKQK